MTALVRSVAAAAVALACMSAAPAMAQSLNLNQNGSYGNVQLRTGFEPDPHTVSVTAGGDIEMNSINSNCNGHVARRATFTLRYRAGEELPLIISATSDGDTTLAVRTPSGEWFCNDDTDGLNPLVRFDDPQTGRYQIWVGTFGEETTAATLNISEVAGQASIGDRPDFTLDPAYGSIDLVSGFTPDPHTVAISAGGELDAASLGIPGCVGHVARAPDYRVNWTAGSGNLPLVISVASDADTTLVVNDAQGNWLCDDDSGNAGLNPAITIAAPASGQYDIWVGTYADGELQNSTLHVSELYAQ